MRGLVATVAVSLALILGIGLLCGIHSRSTSEDFKVRVERVATAVKQERWDEALELARAAEKDWENCGQTLSMWVNHLDVDAVSVGLSQLHVSLEEKEAYHALLYAAELEEALSLIYHRDAFTLKNIL